MLECLIVGDSIAVGTSNVKMECESYAKSGINSSNWNKKYKDVNLKSEVVIISLGSNDYKGIDTEKEIKLLRNKVKASRVYWILPAIKPHVQDIVKKVAEENGDIILPITRLQKDGIHPSWAGYKELAEKAK
ncbi:SGNH_hydrolase domain containing protein [uncultured Caudovirales phage]|uniref:SGNH_hydrolase domain containing protein n=1 Tax=uncultured Caudovirales phage TaxID=2100421 RepID=A0A6J5LIZ9_9CAUD|nr:SGNH_hydrolase domain containing protein [uncultured Caudovirales phage]